MPASSTRCCGASRARARSALADARHRAARHAGLADGALDRALRRRDRARHRRRATATSRRSISPSRATPKAGRTRLRGRVLPTGSVRTVAHGPVSQLPGYRRGRLVGAGRRRRAAGAAARRCARARRVADLCAAPGGKTAQLALAGAQVTAVDRSRRRGSTRLRENLARLQLAAEIVAADAAAWQGGPFDAVLVDAPCSSTGTIRRHPDIPWLKSRDRPRQARRPAAPAARPRGRRCSSRAARWSTAPARSNPRRASSRSRRCWRAMPALRRSPIAADEVGGHAEFLTAGGRSAHPALPLARSGPAHGRARRLLRRRESASRHLTALIAGWPLASRASLYVARGKRGDGARGERGERVDGRACRSRSGPSCRCSLARRALRSVAGRLQRPSADRAGASCRARPTGC